MNLHQSSFLSRYKSRSRLMGFLGVTLPGIQIAVSSSSASVWAPVFFLRSGVNVSKVVVVKSIQSLRVSLGKQTRISRKNINLSCVSMGTAFKADLSVIDYYRSQHTEHAMMPWAIERQSHWKEQWKRCTSSTPNAYHPKFAAIA